ncbi:PREDICTED: mRNAion factor TCP2 [Prunus dulcis]|uniref:PREDICTED: mRNAion factor TCP2 n=1 Tax=Prunus dulcis TaxID=3755 RepID=A0A5E4EK91_PRUDU|nr:hypothetical protein L3X38_007728 [Prunus dulcis]VVA15031.1 PREDICTED: mRNAion factor TCP2 [Prunus dulcis]
MEVEEIQAQACKFPRIGNGSSRAINPVANDEDQDPSCLDLKRAPLQTSATSCGTTPTSSASRGLPAEKIGTARCGFPRSSETHPPALPPSEIHP